MQAPGKLLRTGLCVFAGISAGFSEMTTGLDANIGFFLLPKEIQGFVSKGFSEVGRGNVYVSEDAASSGYSQTTYRYRHEFGLRMKPNIGFSISPTFYFDNGVGFGFEGSGGFSIDEVDATHTISDSLGRDSYSPIPHAYRRKQTTTNDQVYAKYRYLGLTLTYRRPFVKKTQLQFSLNIGQGSYLSLFRIEEAGGSISYHQSNGHVVSTGTYPATFYTFGIRYLSFAIKPGVHLVKPLTRQLSLRGGLSVPVSYVDKGYKWSEDGGTNESIVFYPANRFVAGNLILSLGIVFHFIGGRS
ncbi:MAG: hypothetical protein GF398_14540 [Chitinivibrionales bacterium]|nr:hypothetical protein [Chitinivibrionales bacterium]